MILLTGASGFTGRHLHEALRDRYTIVAPSHAELDVTDAAQVDAAFANGRFDAVIHAAVQGGPTVMATTLRGYWNIARNAHRVSRVLYFGSGAEYGKHRDLVNVREETIGEEVPHDDYGMAKLVCNTLCRASDNIVNLRIFGLFGPYEGYLLKFISNAVAKTLRGIPLTIRQDVVFDYLWIGDLARLMPAFLEGERLFADLTVTPTEPVSLRAIAGMVLRAAGGAADVAIETPGMNFQYTGDNARLLQLQPGFRFTSMEEAIGLLVAYYRKNIESIDVAALAADDYRRRCQTRVPATTAMESSH
jgi:nucleoside-diphosphate-sugar epimerase